MTRPRRVAGHTSMPPYRTVQLAEVLAANDIVQATESALIVAPRTQLAEPSAVDLRELGTAVGPNIGWWHREYNSLLRGASGIRTYNEMKRSDSTTRSTLRLMKTPILSARWFVEPASDSSLDRKVADFVWWNLTDGMTTSFFPQTLTEALLMLDYGFYMFEKVFRMDDPRPQARGKVTLKKLAPRHPLDLQEWLWDDNGGPAGARMEFASSGGGSVDIPIEKLLIFSFDKEAGDLSGISVLRSAYKPWFYKQQLEKIDAIQKERHGIGVPVVKLPPNFNQNDLTLAQNMGRNLRTNEMAHIVLPPNWEIMFAKLEGQPVDVLRSIEYHDQEIHENVLSPFKHGQGVSVGGGEEASSLFLKATRYVADLISDVINKYLIPQLVDYNWLRLPNGYPKLRARRIGEYADWRTQSFAIRNLVGSNIIRPDDRLEAEIRAEMDLPTVDTETIRVTETPQDPNAPEPDEDDPQKQTTPQGTPQAPQVKAPTPPRVGGPRQTPLPSVTTPRGNAGGDRSGG